MYYDSFILIAKLICITLNRGKTLSVVISLRGISWHLIVKMKIKKMELLDILAPMKMKFSRSHSSVSLYYFLLLQ
jgi:hypothetical protein